MGKHQRVGVICCTRLKSTRVPGKCGLDINGKSILNHLHTRLLKTGLPITYAYPHAERDDFEKLFYKFDNNEFKEFAGHDDDPLKRMYAAAVYDDLDIIIRVVHDKIFVDEKQLLNCLDIFKTGGHDYLYSDGFTDGTAFEIISMKALRKAAMNYDKVEHITYAIKAVCENPYKVPAKDITGARLLIDFPEDVELMTTLFACLGDDCTLQDVLDFLYANEWAKNINKLPKATIYTCAYNAEDWIEQTMQSVSLQNNFKTDYEYILIDDCSSDDTSFLMAQFASCHSNVKYIRNSRNIGLASSSNLALSRARAKYIVRLDADDYFVGSNCISSMLDDVTTRGLDALYPNFYDGSFETIGAGNSVHHPAGTMFKTLALNHVRFKDGLRNLDGLDVYLRAKEFLNIGYMDKPIFFYRHHETSMSKTNLKQREETKNEIIAGTL